MSKQFTPGFPFAPLGPRSPFVPFAPFAPATVFDESIIARALLFRCFRPIVLFLMSLPVTDLFLIIRAGEQHLARSGGTTTKRNEQRYERHH